MNFKEAVSQALHKYAVFDGRARRSEYWYFMLFTCLINFVFGVIRGVAGGFESSGGRVVGVMNSLVIIALIIPGITVSVRRLHDISKSGWYYLLMLIPVIGWLILLVWFCTDSRWGDNAYGPNPKGIIGASFSNGGIKTDITYENADILSGKSGSAQKSPAVKPTSTAEQVSRSGGIQHYTQLADQFAHLENLFAENPERVSLEAELLAGGEDAQAAITGFLKRCGWGQVSYGWWNGAAGLTCMLRKSGGKAAEKDLIALKSLSTNIWEYHTQVIDTAEKELLALKKESGGYGPDGRIPAEYAHGELLELQNVYPPEKRLEECFAMQNSVDGWSSADQAFYYFIAGVAARVLYPINKSNLAFYAAQVFADPNPNSLGWQHLREAEGNDLPATKENAQRMHEKYPLPRSMEEAKTYIYSLEDIKDQKPTNDPYSLEQGLNELTDLFRTYPQVDHEKIQTVGRKIYDAEIPLVSGVGGMHQLYHLFHQRFPMYAPELSRIWDGIGDWAD